MRCSQRLWYYDYCDFKQKQTGHKSVEVLRLYERVTENQRKVVSGIVHPMVDRDSALEDTDPDSL